MTIKIKLKFIMKNPFVKGTSHQSQKQLHSIQKRNNQILSILIKCVSKS